LFLDWKSVSEIVKQRALTLTTIELHIIKLYIDGKISIIHLLKLTDMTKVQEIKEMVQEKFPHWVEKLRELKEELEESWNKKIGYLDIKITLAMLEKKDI